jgi:adenylate kinase family enzyme
MSPQTFLFYGRSGSGKGTQVDLLINYLAKIDPKRKSLHIETGDLLRDFTSSDKSYTAKKVKEIIDGGGLLPEFVPIALWGNFMFKNIFGDEHIICDGVARRVPESPVLDSAFRFYGRENPHIVLIDVSPEWAMEKLLARGRTDDTKEGIAKRSKWFDDNVRPAIKFFEDNPYYKFHEINGEQTIEEVHREILTAVKI